LVAPPDCFHDYTDEGIRCSVRKKDEIEAERVTVSKGYWARQTGESPRKRFGGYLNWGDCVDVE